MRPPNRPLAAALCALVLIGCSPDAPEVPDAPDEAGADAGWRVHVAGPEAGEEHPGSVLLTRRADAAGDVGYRPRLVLGCEEGVTRAYVEWGTPLGSGTLAVAYRVDDGPARSARWQISDDGEAAGLWGDRESVPFIRALLGRGHVATEVTPLGGRAVTSRFALGGLDSLVVSVQERCGWE